ncbi:hypothetical protein [Aquisphaera insulae]|uniref:hypothetical protein n=1 Tax=Aquisphaera insulae TaxID=2712864 RepID=UPI0013EDA49B|nr:hypothetical protein [Aquisphaera insulae]
MDQALIVRGHYVGRTFIPEGPLPDTEGAAELVIIPTPVPTTARPRGSIADAFGTAAVLRSGDDILAQVQADRDEWGDR